MKTIRHFEKRGVIVLVNRRLFARSCDVKTIRHLLRHNIFQRRAHFAAGLFDSDDHRRFVERHRHRGYAHSSQVSA